MTTNERDIESAFTWSPDGQWIAHIMDSSVCITSVACGETIRLTPPSGVTDSPRPEACLFSPDGAQIAFVRSVVHQQQSWNQLFVLRLP